MKLTQNERDHLSDVIAEMELKTCGEIRVMIVKRSALGSHVPFTLWSLLTALAMIAVWYWPLPIFAQIWFVPVLLVVTWILSRGLAGIEFIGRRLMTFGDMHHQVWARAEVEFHREGLGDTTSHTGVLIFVSLFERQAVVLADKAIASKVPEGAWDKVIGTVVEGARTAQWASKLELAIRECGGYLAAHFPPVAGKVNELSNEIIIKD